ncbi:MAG: coproporphyrinogen dehydrogenase HemZ [Lachnospiraceae bacterium]|nr:coproporphyrinogen dehydrogenase HemZ [Lachnospiraceae bacterium]
MIGIELNEENFEYDIYSLVKAFYPGEEVARVSGSCDGLTIRVEYQPAAITVALQEAAEEDSLAAKTISETISTEGLERKETKSVLKRALYRLLSEKTGRVLPWGTLTGIRPTKIPFAMLSEGKSDEEIASYMKETYLAGEEKTALSIEIAKREQEILKAIDYEDGYSLYVGIPFCPTRCLYCSFTSYPLKIWEKQVDAYVEALCKELRFLAEKMKYRKLNTVYIGGGTPTTLNPQQMDRLLTVLEESFDFSNNQEFTVEAGRPDSITEDKLLVLKNHKVSRISVNPQTMNQKTLDLIGRRHTVEQTKEAFRLARRCGFDNINMDLISGLPGENREDMEYTMQEIAALKPDSVTVHALAIKRASRLNELWEEYKGRTGALDEETARMMERYTRQMGLVPYYLYRQKNMAGNLENVGYARLDKAGIYNILIMEEKQTIVACGAGSITKRVFPDGRIERCDNVKDVALYIEKIDEMIERKRRLLQIS